MTEYGPLIGAQYPVRREQQLNTQFIRPFPPCGSGLAAWSTCERNWAWLFLTTCLYHHWRHGNRSNGGLQAVSCNVCRKTWEALQQNHAMDQMQSEFFTTALCHYVPSWISIIRRWMGNLKVYTNFNKSIHQWSKQTALLVQGRRQGS